MAIDVHAHYVPPHMIDALQSRGRDFGITLKHGPDCRCAVHFDDGPRLRPFFPKLIENLDARLAEMDRTRIDQQVLSSWTDLYAPHLDEDPATVWHQFLNGHLRDIRDRSPARFAYLASLPLPHAEAAARMLEHEVREHGALGAVIPANIHDRNLGEIDLDPLWHMAETLDVAVFLHPVQAVPQTRSARFGLTQTVQYTCDTTLTAGSLIMSGVLDRFPRLKLLLAHGGGALPYLIGRFDIMHQRMDKIDQKNVARSQPSAYLRRFFYDSIVHDPSILAWLASRVSVERVVLGSDYSFPPADLDPVSTVDAARFPPADRQAILSGNARVLFPAILA